jgi:Tol biopolymer transport system component
MFEMTKSAYTKTTAVVFAVLAATILALAAGARPADATFGGTNGDIAYYKSGDVWTMDANGANARQLTNNYNAEDNPTYSPDGSRIVYEFLRGLWIMDADGSDKRQLTDGTHTDEDPVFSADGTRVVFTRNQDLYEINVDGSGLRNLTNTPNFEERDAAYSPNGDRIAYTRIGCEGGPGAGATCVYIMRADGSAQTNLTPERILPQCPNSPGYYHNGSAREPSFSPDGSKIAFAGSLICPNTVGQDIWVMNIDGSGKTNLITDNGTADRRPVFSPDGTRILFESNRDNYSGPPKFYTMGVGGGSIARLTTATTGENNADWKPDVPTCDVTGTSAADTLTGTSAMGETICGLGGDDAIQAGAGDVVLGGAGNDVLSAPSGSATLNGGPNIDTANFAGSTNPINASLTTGFAVRLGTTPLQGVGLAEVENVTGSGLDDTIAGSTAANSLTGGAGADTLLGLEGNDRINSRDNKNRNDTVNGGPGKDRCTTDDRELSIRACE